MEKEKIKEVAKVIATSSSFTDNIALMLTNAVYDTLQQTITEFAEKLKKELNAKCVAVHPISNPCKWDMSRDKVFELIDILAKSFKAEKL